MMRLMESRVEASVKRAIFEFDLPDRLILSIAAANRSDAQLMVIDRQRQTIQRQHFVDFAFVANPDDLLVFNDTRVIPARLFWQGIGAESKCCLSRCFHLGEYSFEYARIDRRRSTPTPSTH